VDVSDFQAEVIEASRERPVLVDFWAPWCGPCRILGPVLEKLASERGARWTLAKLNTDENPAVASRYRISSIPAVKLFVDGEPAAEFVGALPEARVRQWLDENLPDPTRQRLQVAIESFDAGDEAAAEATARETLASDPENAEAQMLLARALVLRDPDEALGLAREAARKRPALTPAGLAIDAVAGLARLDVASIAPDGRAKEAYVDAAEKLAAADVDGALSKLIEAIRVDRRYADDAPRKACLAIFTVLGEKHPVTRKHRQAFNMAVF
jgi:putative thioredoxin